MTGRGAWFEDNYPGEFSSSYLYSQITHGKLEGYNLFFFSASYKPKLGPKPTEEEAAAIVKYVKDGGVVILAGDDNYWGLWSNEYPNVIASRFNVIFNTDRLLDPTNYDTSVWGSEGGAKRHIVVHNMTPHPTTEGVNEVIVHGSCSLINNNTQAAVILAGDDDTYSDVYDDYSSGSYPPMAIALQHGQGRIVFLGDPGFYRTDAYDNNTFGLNILTWLVQP